LFPVNSGDSYTGALENKMRMKAKGKKSSYLNDQTMMKINKLNHEKSILFIPAKKFFWLHLYSGCQWNVGII
jgi:hypothetical protein